MLAVPLLAAGCGTQTAQAPRTHVGGTLRIALVGAPGQINPLRAANESAVDVDELIYDGLVRVSSSQQPVPDLARSWSVSANGLTWTFRLRKALWQDGAAVTSRDVAFSLRAYMNPANGSAAAALLADVGAISTPGLRTVEVQLKQPDAAFLLDVGTLPVLPYHLLGKIRPGKALLSSPYLGDRAVGTGPLELISARDGQFVLRRNPHYFLGSVRLSGLRLEVYPTARAALLALQAGKVDMAPVPPADAAAVATWPRVRLSTTTAPDYLMVGWNFSDTLFSSPMLRTALVYAVNRQAIVTGTLGGYGIVAQSILPPGSWAYDAAVPSVPYDPAQARRLLLAAGWQSRGGPFLVDKTGRPLRFSILVDAESTLRVAAARLVAQDLRAVGVDASVSAVPFGAYVSDLVQGNFGAALLERGIAPDPDQSAYYLSGRQAGPDANFTAYADHTVDLALAAELGATTQKARKAAFSVVQMALHRDPPGIFLAYPDYIYALSNHFGGFTPNGYQDFFSSPAWYRN